MFMQAFRKKNVHASRRHSCHNLTLDPIFSSTNKKLVSKYTCLKHIVFHLISRNLIPYDIKFMQSKQCKFCFE